MPNLKDKVMYGRQPLRSFVILARSDTGTWRVKQVTAASHIKATTKYSRRFEYEIMGVALLEGSGHPIEWSHGAPTT